MKVLRSWIIAASIAALAACGREGPVQELPMLDGVPLSVQARPMVSEPLAKKWMRRHETLLAKTRRHRADLIFIGDSLTQSWEREGKAVWERQYTPRHALNLGLDGDRTETLLWRIENGALEGLSPKLVVLQIGTNNTGHRMDAAEDTVLGIRAVITEIETRLPDANILVLALFPRGDVHDAEHLRNREINDLLAAVQTSSRVHYRNINQALTDGSGRILASATFDDLHLNADGYARWASAIADDIARLLSD